MSRDTTGTGTILGDVDYRAYAVGPRRDTIHDLHGPRGPTPDGEDGPCWPSPYATPYGSRRFRQELERPVRPGATSLWQHGMLVQAISEEVVEAHRARWGDHRVADATVGPIDATALAISPADRDLMHAFCIQRGWQRVLVRAFAHVGCKATHVGRLDIVSLARPGSLGGALFTARHRPRLAVLEEAVRCADGDLDAVFADLDQLDRALDAAGLGESFFMSACPNHCSDLAPLRNLMRLADRHGQVLRDLSEPDLGEENSYVPEHPILCVDRHGYGGGFMNHDIYHFLAPVEVGKSALSFVIGNSAIEADGQLYNNLIYLHRHSGPDYEGHGPWAEPRIFETIERALGTASFPQAVEAGRLLTLVLSTSFEGDILEVLGELCPSLVEGDLDTLLELLGYFINHIQRDQHFLWALWPRYETPVHAEWARHLGGPNSRVVDGPRPLVAAARDLLWDLEDIDLRSFDHILRGQVAERRTRHRYTCFKACELHLLVEMAANSSPDLRRGLDELLQAGLRFDDRWRALGEECAVHTDQVPPGARDDSALARLSDDYEALAMECDSFSTELRRLVQLTREEQKELWEDPVRQIPPDFESGYTELFQDFQDDGHFYDHPRHDPEDRTVEVWLPDGQRVLVHPPRVPIGVSIRYPELHSQTNPILHRFVRWQPMVLGGEHSALGHPPVGPRTTLQVCPTSTADLAYLVKHAAQYETPLRVQGAGTSFYGTGQPRDDELFMRTQHLVHARFERPGTVTVGGGVGLWALRCLLRCHGLDLPVHNDGAGSPSVGGFVCAGGIGKGSAVHGGLWDNVHQLVVVDGRGEVQRVTRAAESFPWYFGAGGLLGVVVEVVLSVVPVRRDAPTPDYPQGLEVSLDDAAVERLTAETCLERPLAHAHMLPLPCLVWPEELPAAMAEFDLLEAHAGGAIVFGERYVRPVRWRRLMVPLVYPSGGDFVAVGPHVAHWAHDDEAFEHILAFDDVISRTATRRGWRRHHQLGPNAGPARLLAALDDKTSAALRCHRTEADPLALFHPLDAAPTAVSASA